MNSFAHITDMQLLGFCLLFASMSLLLATNLMLISKDQELHKADTQAELRLQRLLANAYAEHYTEKESMNVEIMSLQEQLNELRYEGYTEEDALEDEFVDYELPSAPRNLNNWPN